MITRRYQQPMQVLVFIFIVSSFLTSCCVFSSQDCNCTPPKSFLNESAKDWIAPLLSEQQKFTTLDSSPQEQNLSRNYTEGSECLGGDECCSDFSKHEIRYVFDDGNTLVYTRAIKNEVDFSTDNSGVYSETVFIASLDVTTGIFSKSNAITLIEKDTTINGSSHQKVIFRKVGPMGNIRFTSLEFVEGVGVTSYTDTAGKLWVKKQ